MSGAQYFLYTPGKGVTALPSPTNILNNNGDMMFGSKGAQYIQTSSGQIPLPSASTWTSVNDSNEAVEFSRSTSPQVLCYTGLLLDIERASSLFRRASRILMQS
jgi:hypothetical protein